MSNTPQQKPLTKDQRYTAYCIMLEELKVTELPWICPVAKICFDIDLDNDFRFSNLKIYFPELWKKRNEKTDEGDTFLWESRKERVAALKQCIAETQNF